MEPWSGVTRATNLRRLAESRFDVLVIGGGITGAGVALDAAARGYSVALVEKADFASGTSSKSTKLVHGGIRYLPQFDFGLVHEALVERGLLIQNAPYLVRPLTFVLPLYEDAQRPVGVPFTLPGGRGLGLMLHAGLWMYDLMAGRRSVGRHRRISAERAEELVPMLHRAGLKEAVLYSDAQTNDSRLTIAVLRTAAQHGAVIANYAQVTGFTRQGNTLSGAQVRDVLTDEMITISARHIVNATGVFAEQAASLANDMLNVKVEPSKGVHLVVPRERVGINETAAVLPETDDKRILFVLPWGSRAIIGTTDTGTGDLDHPTATSADIQYLLRHVNRYLDVQLTEDDILTVYAGYRPLVSMRDADTSKISRTHVVLQDPSGLVTIVGGKLTTYRRMAQDTVDVLAKRDGMPRAHPTQRLPLSGAVGWRWAQSELRARAQVLGLAPDITEHLAFNYGRNAETILDLIERDPDLSQRLEADLPYVRAEVVYASHYEMAIRLDDVLARRTRLILEAHDQGTRVAPEVAQLMGKELGWSPARVHAEEEQYTALTPYQRVEAEKERLLH
ncbi:MAG: glycerol-3-phosphate dehydrogenase [Ktedonobacterales bacterium]